MGFTDSALIQFIKESNLIEGIHGNPTSREVTELAFFLGVDYLTLDNVSCLQKVFAPGFPLRRRQGMNVRVDEHIAPLGGSQIPKLLDSLLDRINYDDRLSCHEAHLRFESLHPYLDGNGRIGRAIWAWQMTHKGGNAFNLPFLHRFYYQTLQPNEKE